MILIKERETKQVPGLTSFFINFNYKPEIVSALKTLGCKAYNKKTLE